MVRLLVIVATFFGFAFATNPAQAINLVVFEVEGPALTPGQVVDGAQIIKLEAGQTVALISDSGQVIRLSGPFNRAPLADKNAGKGGIKEALKNLMASTGSESGSLGVSRSADDVFNMASKKNWMPDPWLIDVSQAGSQCHRQGDNVVFWRSEKAQDVPIKVRVGKGEWEGTAKWSKGKSKLALPSSMPQRDGVTYRIEVAGVATKTTMHLIPKTVTAKPAVAAWMKAKGCKNQSLALIRTLK